MRPQLDHKYMQLYREYAKAIQAFENATQDRRRVRNHLSVKQSPRVRRPIATGRYNAPKQMQRPDRAVSNPVLHYNPRYYVVWHVHYLRRGIYGMPRRRLIIAY